MALFFLGFSRFLVGLCGTPSVILRMPAPSGREPSGSEGGHPASLTEGGGQRREAGGRFLSTAYREAPLFVYSAIGRCGKGWILGGARQDGKPSFVYVMLCFHNMLCRSAFILFDADAVLFQHQANFPVEAGAHLAVVFLLAFGDDGQLHATVADVRDAPVSGTADDLIDAFAD